MTRQTQPRATTDLHFNALTEWVTGKRLAYQKPSNPLPFNALTEWVTDRHLAYQKHSNPLPFNALTEWVTGRHLAYQKPTPTPILFQQEHLCPLAIQMVSFVNMSSNLQSL